MYQLIHNKLTVFFSLVPFVPFRFDQLGVLEFGLMQDWWWGSISPERWGFNALINFKVMLAIINYVVLPCVLLRKSLRQKNHGINGLIRTVRQAIVYCLWNGVCRWPVSFYFFFVYYPCLSSEVLYMQPRPWGGARGAAAPGPWNHGAPNLFGVVLDSSINDDAHTDAAWRKKK